MTGLRVLILLILLAGAAVAQPMAPFSQLEARSGLLQRGEYRLVDQALRLGDVAGASSLISRLKTEGGSSLLLRLLLLAAQQQVGLNCQVDSQGRGLLPLLAGDEESELYLRMVLLVSALHRFDRPGALEQLERALPLARRGVSRSARLDLFCLETVEFYYKIESQSLPLDSYLRRRQEIWASFRQAPLSERLAPFELTWAFKAAQLWTIMDGVEAHDLGPEQAQPVEKAFEETMGFLLGLWFNQSTLENVEACFGNLEVGLGLVETFRRSGELGYSDYSKARLTLQHLMTPALNFTDAALPGFSNYQSQCAEFGVVGQTPRWWHAQARFRLEKVRLLLAEDHPDLTQQASRDLDEAHNLLVRGAFQSDQIDSELLRARLLQRTLGEHWQEQALGLAEAAYRQSEALGYWPGVVEARRCKGQIYDRSGDRKRAIEAFQACIAEIEQYVAMLGGGTAPANRFRSWYRNVYERLTQLQLESGQPVGAFATADRLRQLSTLPPAPPLPAKYAQPLSSSREAMRGAEEALALNGSSPASRQLAQGKQKFFQVLSDIRASDPDYERLLAVRPVNFAQVQKSIPSDAVILQALPGQNRLYLFVVSRDDFHIRTVDVTRQQLSSWVVEARRQLRGKGADLKALISLHQVLIEPVAKELQGKRLIAFIPSEILNYLPLSALARSKGGASLEFLVERFQVVVLVKAADLFAWSGPLSAHQGSLVAFGNPDGTLAMAETEVLDLGKLFPKSQVFVGPQATHKKLTETAEGARFLHLATHAMLDRHDPNQSLLILAGKALKLPEVYGLPLHHAELVTLSACDTALGEATPGSELTSLAQAFSVAGSPSVLATLWSVDDDSTRQLMVEFYRRLVTVGQGGTRPSKSQALQEAQLYLLGRPSTAHPFYWAPFEILGDGR